MSRASSLAQSAQGSRTADSLAVTSRRTRFVRLARIRPSRHPRAGLATGCSGVHGPAQESGVGATTHLQYTGSLATRISLAGTVSQGINTVSRPTRPSLTIVRSSRDPRHVLVSLSGEHASEIDHDKRWADQWGEPLAGTPARLGRLGSLRRASGL